MILQALTHLYTELERQGKIPAVGWCKAKVTHRLILGPDGELLGIISAKKKVLRGKKEVEVPDDLDAPERAIRTVAIKANFLCDNATYMFGIDTKDKANSDRARQCFETARELHHAVLDGCDSPAAHAVLAYFDNWNTDKATEYPAIQENMTDILGVSNFIFQFNGTNVTEDEKIRLAWSAYKQRIDAGDDAYTATCLVTGKQNQVITALHPQVKDLPGSGSTANLISYNSDAFCSHGLDHADQGKNAPISKTAAFEYGTALNYLLGDKEHKTTKGGTTIVYWSEHAISVCQDCMSALLGNEHIIDDKVLESVVNHMMEGKPVSLDGVEISEKEPFYILGFVPNMNRISIRFFLRNTFGQVMKNLTVHQNRMQLVHAEWEKDRIPLWRTLRETVNPHSKDGASSPLLAGSLFRAVLTDSRYPEAVYQNIMMRIFADHDEAGESGKYGVSKINYARAAFIKAYLLKNGKKCWKEQLNMEVNENCKEISYVLGRLFSVLEEVQQSANPGINATIKDRYYNSACATPASTFPILWKLANSHLAKLRKGNPGRAINLQKKLGNLMGKIEMPNRGVPLPARLTLEEQGAFVLGYYQENRLRYTKKDDEEVEIKEEQ